MNYLMLMTLATIFLLGCATSYQGGGLTFNSRSVQVQKIISQCDVCHGIDADNSIMAPKLGGMPGWYIEEQLHNFRSEKRGFDTVDPASLAMTFLAKALTESEVAEIADHYSDQELVLSEETVEGDGKKGERLYQDHCARCHSSLFGRFFTSSPKISNLDGRYLLAQLTLFASGKRLFLASTKHKENMTEVTKSFSAKELADIVAFMKLKDE